MGLRAAFRAAIGANGSVRGTVLTATDGRDILVNSPDGWEISQPWLWWAGPAGSDGTGGPWGNPPPGADGGNLAAGIPAVMRCTSIICDTIAGLPWRVMKGYDQLPTPSWISDPQLLRADGRVAGNALVEVRYSAVEFWASWIASALWFGDGFIWVAARDVYGAPKPGAMFLLHPDDVVVDHGRYWPRGSDVPFGPEEILHLRGEPPYDRDGRGTGVLTRHAADLGLAVTMRSYAASVYTTGVPAGYLKVNDPDLTQEQADGLKARWMAAHGSSRKSIAILNATTDFQAIAITPVDSQLDSAKSWGLRDIALMFGVPSYMLGVPGDSSTYANVESRMTELRTFTLLPWQRRIESTLDAQLPAGTSLKIATDGLARADTAARFAAYESALRAGWITVDEVRALEDRPPLPEQVSTDPVADDLPPVPDDASALDGLPADFGKAPQ
jgi:HK97 family phage portal protein